MDRRFLLRYCSLKPGHHGDPAAHTPNRAARKPEKMRHGLQRLDRWPFIQALHFAHRVVGPVFQGLKIHTATGSPVSGGRMHIALHIFTGLLALLLGANRERASPSHQVRGHHPIRLYHGGHIDFHPLSCGHPIGAKT